MNVSQVGVTPILAAANRTAFLSLAAERLEPVSAKLGPSPLKLNSGFPGAAIPTKGKSVVVSDRLNRRQLQLPAVASLMRQFGAECVYPVVHQIQPGVRQKSWAGHGVPLGRV